MRSIRLWILLVSLMVQITEGWRINTDVVDLTVLIQYQSPKTLGTKPDRLKVIIQALANELELSQQTTRMAIWEMFDNFVPLLSIEKGTEVNAVDEALLKMDNSMAKWNQRMPAANRTKDIRQDSTRAAYRTNVPHIIVVFAEVGTHDFLDNQTLKQHLIAIADTAALDGAGIVFISSFKNDSTRPQSMVVFPILRKPFEDKTGDHNAVARKVAGTIRSSLQQCIYEETMGACYISAKKVCVANVGYETAFRNSNRQGYRWNGTDPRKWYCFKNGTIPCPNGEAGCLTTTTTAMTKGEEVSSGSRMTTSEKGSRTPRTRSTTTTDQIDDGIDEIDNPNVYYPDDPIIINLKITLIVEGVLLAIVMPAAVIAVLWAVRVSREANRNAQTPSSILRGQYKGWSTQPGPSQWSVTKPPSLTVTPVDELIKLYSMKEKRIDKTKETKASAAIGKSIKNADSKTAKEDVTVVSVGKRLVKKVLKVAKRGEKPIEKELKAAKATVKTVKKEIKGFTVDSKTAMKADIKSIMSVRVKAKPVKKELKVSKEAVKVKTEDTKMVKKEIKAIAADQKAGKRDDVKSVKNEQKVVQKEMKPAKTVEKQVPKVEETVKRDTKVNDVVKKNQKECPASKKAGTGKSTTKRRKKKMKSPSRKSKAPRGKKS